jgi:hypothetical protein
VANPSPVRRLLVLALGALLLAPATPSRSAGLGANVIAGAEAHFNIYGSDRASYLIDMVVQASEAGTRSGTGSLAVTIRRCLGAGCSKRTTYVGALPDGAFTVADDLTSGYLSASLFGKAVVLTWDQPQGPTLASYQEPGAQAAVRLYQVTKAGGLLVGKPCNSKDGLVSRSVRVDSADVVTRVMPRTFPRALAGMAKGRCSRPVP